MTKAERELVLTTPRLRLTTWCDSDTDDLTALHSDPLVMADMASGTQTAEQTRARIQVWIGEHRARGWSKWRVADQDDRLLGRAGFGTAHHTGHREIGYLLRRDAWGRGLATELADALVRWHYEHPDPTISTVLHGYVYDTNAASNNVLLNAGFRAAGRDPRNPHEVLFVHEHADIP